MFTQILVPKHEENIEYFMYVHIHVSTVQLCYQTCVIRIPIRYISVGILRIRHNMILLHSILSLEIDIHRDKDINISLKLRSILRIMLFILSLTYFFLRFYLSGHRYSS